MKKVSRFKASSFECRSIGVQITMFVISNQVNISWLLVAKLERELAITGPEALQPKNVV